jgi:hypothetical protein
MHLAGCHLKCHRAACLCFAALRLFPSVHISDLDPSPSFPRVQDRYQKPTQSRSDLGQFLRGLGKLIVDIIPHPGKAPYLI